jgi:hypothetical protein
MKPLEIGIVFYFILFVFIFTFLGCKTIEIKQDKIKLEYQIKQDANDIFKFPDLTQQISPTNKK